MSHPSRVTASLGDVPAAPLVAVPVAITAILWATSSSPIDARAGLGAALLLFIPWGSYLHWRGGTRRHLPLFAMVSGAYWVSFGVPLFWGQRMILLEGYHPIEIPDFAIFKAVDLGCLAVMCLWVGLRAATSTWRTPPLLEIVDEPRSWAYVRALTVAGPILALSSQATYLLGAEGREIMLTLLVTVPTVGFVLLLSRWLGGNRSHADRAALIGSGALQLMAGVASGALAPVVDLCVMCAAVILLKRGRISWKLAVLTGVVVVFLQASKADFRSVYWSGEDQGSLSERGAFWISRSIDTWRDALSGTNHDDATSLASQSVERLSLVPQVAHVLDLTPSDVPFQWGSTYQYVAVTLIPRFLWPDKPSVNDANRFYQVAYGLSSEKGLNTSISVGIPAEAYMNFGWAGVIVVMVFAGFALGMFERVFANADSSSLFLAVGIALLPGLLVVESQLGQYFGGVLQHALLTIFVFAPIARRRRDAVFTAPSFDARLPVQALVPQS